MHRINALSLDYFLLDRLLFKIIHDKIMKDPKPVLCIPTSKVDMLLGYYHSSLMGGHMGITKTYFMISQQFYCPNLVHHVRAYIIGCHVCQMVKAGKPLQRPLQKRININVLVLCKISMDIKHMPPIPGRKPKLYILVLLCEVSNFMVVHGLKAAQSMDVCLAIRKSFIKPYGPPTHIICDQDPAFMSALTQNFFCLFRIRVLTVGPTNHKSLLAEHSIKSLAEVLKCDLSTFGTNWMQYLDFAMLTYNSYCTPNLDGMCPYELVFGHKPNILPISEALPHAPITGTHKEFYENLKSKLEYLRKHLVQFRDRRIELVNRNREHHGFFQGQVVYVFMPKGAAVQTVSRKMRITWVGPLIVFRAYSPNQFALMTLEGNVFPGLYEETRLRPGWIKTSQGPVNNLADYKKITKSTIKPIEQLPEC